MPEPAEACGRCLKKPPPVDRVFAAFRYGFPVDRLEQRFKFHHDLAAGRELSSAMCTMLRSTVVEAERPQALLAIPLHPQRLRERGYNQAVELARPLAKAFAIPLRHDVLQRIRNIPPQSRLGALARRR
ncbi:MAG: ComF family protein, partial [Lysobacteraceae bacterium]